MNNQKNTKKEENILVLCMSKLSLKPELNHYYYKTKENTYSYYDCIGQLEPACKVVIDELSKDSQSNHLKILVLNTNETIQDSVKVPIGKEKKSSYEFFKDRIKSFCSGSEPEYHAKLIANTEQIMKNQYPELRWIILELIQCVRESSNKTDSWYYKMDQILLTILKMNFDSKISPYISDQPSTSFTQILARRITTASTDHKTNNFQEQLSVDTLKNFFQEQLTLYFHTASDDSDHISFYDSLYNLWHTSLKNFSESTKFTASNELINTLYKVIQMILDQKNLDSFLSCSDKDKLDKILLELDSLKRQQEHLLSILSTDTRMIDNSSLISNIISQMNQKLTLFLADKIQLKTYIIQQIWNKLILNSTNTICTNNRNDISTNNSHTYEDSQLQILEARKNLKIDFEQINIGTQIDSRFQDIITEICKPKNSMDSDVKINVYIDTQGGSRENSTILTAILELLKKSHTDQTIVKNIYATQYTPGEAIHEIQDKEDAIKVNKIVFVSPT